MSPITDICTAINEIKGLNSGVGYLRDESAGRYRHEVYFLNEQIRREKDATSLEQLLQLSQQRPFGSTLNRRERLHLAVTLASSVLQLDGTSWLKKRWTSSDILFLPSDDRMSTTSSIDVSYPYASWQIIANKADLGPIAKSDHSLALQQIRNEDLFALGCILIELSLNQRLSDRRVPEDIQPNNEVMTDFNTATRLVNAVYDESGGRYGDVVQRCLTCPFNLRNLRNFRLDNEELQEAVFDYILTPLRQDLEDFNGDHNLR